MGFSSCAVVLNSNDVDELRTNMANYTYKSNAFPSGVELGVEKTKDCISSELTFKVVEATATNVELHVTKTAIAEPTDPTYNTTTWVHKYYKHADYIPNNVITTAVINTNTGDLSTSNFIIEYLY